MMRDDGSLSIIGVWFIGGVTIFLITMAWAITAGPLTVVLDTFLGLDSAISEMFVLSDMLKNAMAWVLIIGDGGTLAWMIFSSFKKESVEGRY